MSTTRIAIYLFFVATFAPHVAHADAKLDWSITAYADGAHNAFTDLVCWKDAYYLGFRHGQSHGSLDGEIRVMRSTDMKTWSPCATVDTAGDDRDAKFVATDDTLYLYFGTWDIVHQPGHAAPDRGSIRSYVATTQDGRLWSKPQGVYEPGFWLWRIRVHDGFFYSPAYTAIRPVPSARETRLLRSRDGLAWELVSTVTNQRMAGEADILWRPDGAVWILSRTGDKAGDAVLFTSDAKMQSWTPHDTGVRVHSPVFAAWKDRVFVSGRDNSPEQNTTKLWEVSENKLTELLTLPSNGDTAYPGLIVAPEAIAAPAFFITWYSQHNNAPGDKTSAAVYAAHISLLP